MTEQLIEDGWYIVEANDKRQVAEWYFDQWWQAGSDYDTWADYGDGGVAVTIIAKIDLDTLTITPWAGQTPPQ